MKFRKVKEYIKIKRNKRALKELSKLYKHQKTKEIIAKNKFKKHTKKIDYQAIDEIHKCEESKICNNIISMPIATHRNINNNVNYTTEYMQDPVEILTEDNIKRLEEHYKKAIYYERRKKKEHEITLCLLYEYREQLEKIEKQNKIIEKQNKIIDKMANNILIFRADEIVPTNIEGIKQFFKKEVEKELNNSQNS